ncbi:SKI/DACH domain-containing protein 1-like [Polyodon spathula]|uniref:SKI/DACH domain-containing protein 1-like n=1 Tax=Polyodon spathula TaxID=7913 RepID=UPI001B7DC44B|nr:SKI/DACH domain-containing protein 1-like [Polyodon spathula]
MQMVETILMKMKYNCNSKNEAFQTGYQEIEGINMGFLRIKGRQMFALAQVFSDLFKDIPRTTVNKRMEVLNIRSRRCDIQELRTLKAIHSVPVRAVKCSLITKEDLEALCASCQTLSPKKRRKKRKCKKTENDSSSDTLSTRLCKKNNTDAKTLLAKDSAVLTVAGAAQRARRLRQLHSKPAQNFSKSKNTGSSQLLEPVTRDLRNYEKVAKGLNCYGLKGVNGILPQAFVGTYPNKTLHSAIAGNDCSKTSLPLCLRGKNPCYSRYEEYSNGCVKKRDSPALLMGNKSLNFASKNGKIGGVSAGGLKKAHCAQGTSAGYSSDSESSLDLEKDSDFGSSFQSTSTESSDEDDHLDGISALSSSSEEGSSSESDSSSVCSGDSVQSTRYRQAALPTPISRFQLPSSRDAEHEKPASRLLSTEPPLEIKTEPPCLDPGFLLPEQHGQRWATCTPTFNCSEEIIKPEPNWAATTGSCLTAETERKRDHAAAFIGDRAKHGASPLRPQGRIEPSQQKAPSLDPQGGFEAALPLLKNGNYLHKGSPDNGTSLGIADQAESQIKALSPESAFQNAPSCSSGAPIQAAVQNCTGTDRICIVADPAGDIKEQRKDKFERLIRTSKLWCYAKGFNFDGKNAGYTTAAAYEAAARVFKSKVSKNHSGGAAAAAGGGGGGSFFKTFNSPKSKGRSTLSSKAFKVNGLERNLKRNRAPKRNDAERKQRCTKGASKRGKKANIRNAAKAGAAAAAAFSCKRKASGGSAPSTPVKRPFSLLDSFTCPPSLVVGEDGDLSPAYSLCSKNCLPRQKAHSSCRMWQLGGSATPVPPSHKFRGYNLEDY